MDRTPTETTHPNHEGDYATSQINIFSVLYEGKNIVMRHVADDRTRRATATHLKARATALDTAESGMSSGSRSAFVFIGSSPRRRSFERRGLWLARVGGGAGRLIGYGPWPT